MFAKRSKPIPNSLVQRFLDPKKDCITRIRNLKQGFDSINDSFGRKTFLTEHSVPAFLVFHESFLIAESTLAGRSIKQGAVEIDLSLWLLEQILYYLPELLSKRWQYHCLGCVFKKLLHPRNTIGLRKQGLRYFLIWYQIIGCGPYNTAEADLLFSTLLPLKSLHSEERLSLEVLCDMPGFTGDCSLVDVAHATVPVAASLCQPMYIDVERSQNGERIVASLVDKIFEYIVRETCNVCWASGSDQLHEKSMRFLFAKVKQHYIPEIMPGLQPCDLYTPKHFFNCKIPLAMSVDDEARDAARNSVVRWIVSYAYSHKRSVESLERNLSASAADASPEKPLVHKPPNFTLVRRVLFGSRQNINFAIAVLKAAMLLPPKYSSTILKVLRVWKEWVMMEEPIVFSLEQTPTPRNSSDASDQDVCAGLQLTLQTVIDSSVLFFFNPTLVSLPPPQFNEVSDIVKRIMSLYRLMVTNVSMTSDTWVFLLTCLVRITELLLSDAGGKDGFADQLASPVFQTLLVTWVRASLNVYISEDMWDHLSGLLQKLTFWPQLADEWAKTMESLTKALSFQVYDVNLSDLPLERLHMQKMKKTSAEQRPRISTDNGSLSGCDTDRSVQNFSRGWSLKENTRQVRSVLTSAFSTPISQAVDENEHETHQDTNGSASTMGNAWNAVPSEQMVVSPAPDLSVVSNVSPTEQASSESVTTGESTSLEGDDPIFLDNSAILSNPDGSSLDKSSLFDRDSLTPSPVHDDEVYCMPDDTAPSLNEVMFENGDAEQTTMAEVDEQNECSVLAGGTQQGWLPDVAAVLWRRSLGLLGNVNRIVDPAVHHQLMLHLSHIVASLLKVRANQGFPVAEGQHLQAAPVYVPPIGYVAPWLLEALQLSSKYAEGQLVAVEVLCTILLQQHQVALGDHMLAQLYASVHWALTHLDQRFPVAVLKACCPQYFHLCAPGAAVTACDFLAASRRILESSTGDQLLRPTHVLAVLAGYAPLVVADMNVFDPHAEQEAAFTRCENFEQSVFAELEHALDFSVETQAPISVKRTVVRGLGVLLHRSLATTYRSTGSSAHKTRSKLMLNAVLKLLLAQLSVVDTATAEAVCEVLQPVPSVECLVRHCSDVAQKVLQRLTSAVHAVCELLADGRSLDAQVSSLLSTLLLTLWEWTLRLPLRFFDESPTNNSLMHQVVDAFVHCLRVCAGGKESRVKHKLWCVASVALEQVVYSVGQWVFRGSGFDANPSVCTDGTHACTTFTCERNTLLRVEALRHSACHMIVRNVAGRYCWQCERLDNEVHVACENLEPASLQHRKEQDTCSATPTDTSAASHSLRSVLESLSESSSECSQPFTCLTSVGLEDKTNQLLQTWLRTSALRNDETMPSAAYRLPGISTVDSFAAGRLLCAELDLCAQSRTAAADLCCMPRSEQLTRELKHLDAGVLCRETHKIAVIYVAYGQEDKTSILTNTEGSAMFQKFLVGLGTTVDLNTHEGYMGGLTAALGHSLYFSAPMMEIMYHVSTLLPSDNLTKKIQHLGNDEVHIVWSEHFRDYRRSIIATEFCDILIVVYPQPNGLFRISIDVKSVDVAFGPLFDGALVAWPSVSVLVRATAVNASRALRRRHRDFKDFCEVRMETLLETNVKVSRLHSPYKEFLSQSLFPAIIAS